MKKVWLVSLALLAHTAIGAEEKILFDFENYAIGETIPMNDIFNGSNREPLLWPTRSMPKIRSCISPTKVGIPLLNLRSTK